MSDPYRDIINLPHHVSDRHPHMTTTDRAAQFSPFAALTGYDAAIKETARQTDVWAEPDESQKAILDLKVRQVLETHQTVRITYFLPDKKKDGGSYVDAEGKVKRVNTLKGVISMLDGREIPISNMVDLCILD